MIRIRRERVEPFGALFYRPASRKYADDARYQQYGSENYGTHVIPLLGRT